MKKKMVVRFLLLCVALNVSASSFKVGDIYYEITTTDKEVSVRCYDYNKYSGVTEVSIPSAVTYKGITYSVTSIGQSSFSECRTLTSITIPESVTRIGLSAFYRCEGLTSIAIPNSVTSIEGGAFQECTSLISITIPKTVTRIEGNVFSSCTNLSSINVESGNKVYDSRDNCNAVIESKSNKLIIGCKNSIIPNSITTVGEWAFRGCGFTSITIPDSVTSIEEEAFAYCSLTSLTIPFSVTSIGRKAFWYCLNLPSITVNPQTGILGTNYEGPYVYYYTSGISLDKTSLSFQELHTYARLTAKVMPHGANETVTWKSSNPRVATVDDNGFVTAQDTGSTIITATTIDGTELSDKCHVSIRLKAGRIGLNQNELYITELESQKVNAIITPTKASQEVAWSSSDTTIVKVDESGNIMPVKNGSATITATTTDGTNLKAACTVRVNVDNLFDAIATQTSISLKSKNEVTEVINMKAVIGDKEYNLSTKDKINGLAPDSVYHIIVTADIGGSKWTEELDVTTKDVAVNFDCMTSPTSLTITRNYDAGDATVTRVSFEKDADVSEIKATGLEPGQIYTYTYYVTTEEGGTRTYLAKFATKALEFKTLEAKIVTMGDIVVSAESNITEEEDVNVGLEWRRYDWPDEIATKRGAAFIYEGKIEGSIRNLNTDKFWKIRPYFQSQSGAYYYGEWITVDPSDYSYFEPTIHTYAKTEVEGNTAMVKGYALGGSDQVAEQGFKYWEVIPSSSSPKYPQVTEVPAYAKTVTASGQLMTAELQDLQYEVEYRYVAFVTTADGKTYYGEEQRIRIDDPVGIKDAVEESIAEGDVRTYTIDGRLVYAGAEKDMMLTAGLYIIRFADGTTKKVVIR